MFLLFAMSLLAKQLEVDVEAPCAILMNAKSGMILFEKQAHTVSYPASTTKIATALFILDQTTDFSKTTTISAESLKPRQQRDRYQLPPHWLDTDGAILMGLRRGETVSLETLLHGLMLYSANDAANAIAEYFAGTVPQFMDQLNAYLQKIGCTKTQFRNPHGLHHPEHFTTAHDLALMTKKALEIPKFRELISTRTYTKPKSNKQEESLVNNTSPLIKANSKHYYSKAIGGKTGYTQAAKDTLVAIAEHEGRCLIAVILGAEKGGARFDDVKKLFESAFNEPKAKRRLIGTEHIFTRDIEGAKNPIRAVVAKAVSIEYFPSEEQKCKALLHWQSSALPIRKGQKVGQIHIEDESGALLQKTDLVALDEVKASWFYRLKSILEKR